MNTIDKKYTDLLQDILDRGVQKKDRTGTGTISVFGRQIRHDMKEGFPLLTSKKMHWKSIVAELIWFLRGDTNIRYLVDNGCHIWDGDCYKNYCKYVSKNTDEYDQWMRDNGNGTLSMFTLKEFLEKIKTDKKFSDKWGNLGPIYGKQWRDWKGFEHGYNELYNDEFIGSDQSKLKNTKGIDQIQNLINGIKEDPDSRRLMVTSWNPSDLKEMVLPPCHYAFQFYTRELSLKERQSYWLNLPIKNPMSFQNSTEKEAEMGALNNPQCETILNLKNIPKRAISLMWDQRSVDTFLGLPFNIASYGLLLEIIAKEVNMVPDELIGNLGDVHLYLNHIEQAREQIGRNMTASERMDFWFNNNKPNRDVCDYVDSLDEWEKHQYFDECKVPRNNREPYSLPKLNIKLHFKNDPSFTPEHWLVDDFVIEDYKSHPAIKAPLSN
jgi:thymidylate synthase